MRSHLSLARPDTPSRTPRRVEDVYRPSVIGVMPADRLLTAAERMHQDGASVAVVFTNGVRVGTNSIAGILTERDLVRAVAEHADLSAIGVADYMTPYPAVVTPYTPLDEAARLMRELEVRHLPVLLGGEVLGILSARDLLDVAATRRPTRPPRGRLLPARRSA